MLRVPIDKVQPGMILRGRSRCRNDPYHYLVQRDREIPRDMIPRLKQLGILEVWVRHRDFEFLEEMFDEELGDCQREVYHRVRRELPGAAARTPRVELDLVHLQSFDRRAVQFPQESAPAAASCCRSSTPSTTTSSPIRPTSATWPCCWG